MVGLNLYDKSSAGNDSKDFSKPKRQVELLDLHRNELTDMYYKSKVSEENKLVN